MNPLSVVEAEQNRIEEILLTLVDDQRLMDDGVLLKQLKLKQKKRHLRKKEVAFAKLHHQPVVVAPCDVGANREYDDGFLPVTNGMGLLFHTAADQHLPLERY